MGHEGAERYAGGADTRDRPGSRRSRLVGAEKQLAIVLQDLDLEAEPDLGAALIEAISAVDRAHHLSEAAEVEHWTARSDRGAPARSEPATKADGGRGRTRRRLVSEAGAE